MVCLFVPISGAPLQRLDDVIVYLYGCSYISRKVIGILLCTDICYESRLFATQGITTILITFCLIHRYKAICDSLRHRAKSWKYIVYVICISCFQNVRKFFEFDVYPVQEHPFKNQTRYLWQEDLLNNVHYIRFEETEDLLMLAVLPIALLIFFNGNIWLQIR